MHLHTHGLLLTLALLATLVAACDAGDPPAGGSAPDTGAAPDAGAAPDSDALGALTLTPPQLTLEEITGHGAVGAITVRNGSDAPVTVTAVLVVTADGTERPPDPYHFPAFDGFRLDPWSVPDLPFPLGPGAAHELLVSFAVLTAGHTKSTLVVQTPERDYSAPLFGVATRCRPWPRTTTCTWTAGSAGAAAPTCPLGGVPCVLLCGVGDIPAACVALSAGGDAVEWMTDGACEEPQAGTAATVWCGDFGAPDCPPEELPCERPDDVPVP